MLQKIKDHLIPNNGNNFSPRIFAAESVVGLVALLAILQVSFVAHTLVLRHSDYMAAILPGILISMTNSDRETLGVQALKTDPLLTKAAQLKANDMATKGYFAHRDPLGRDPWHWLEQVGYDYSYAGENLAIDFSESGEVEQAWMNSPAHRANIVKGTFTHVGIGVAKALYNQKETTFVVQFFAKPVSVIAPTSAQSISVQQRQIQNKKLIPTAPKPKQKIKSRPQAQSQEASASIAKKRVLGVATKAQDAAFIESTTSKTVLSIEDTATSTGLIAPAVESAKSGILRIAWAPSLWYFPILAALFAFVLIILSIAMVVHIGNRRIEGLAITFMVLLGIAVLIYVNFNTAALNKGARMPYDVGYATTNNAKPSASNE